MTLDLVLTLTLHWNRTLLGLYNVNIACDWLSHGAPPLHSSRCTVFDRVDIFYPG